MKKIVMLSLYCVLAAHISHTLKLLWSNLNGYQIKSNQIVYYTYIYLVQIKVIKAWSHVGLFTYSVTFYEDPYQLPAPTSSRDRRRTNTQPTVTASSGYRSHANHDNRQLPGTGRTPRIFCRLAFERRKKKKTLVSKNKKIKKAQQDNTVLLAFMMYYLNDLSQIT